MMLAPSWPRVAERKQNTAIDGRNCLLAIVRPNLKPTTATFAGHYLETLTEAVGAACVQTGVIPAAERAGLIDGCCFCLRLQSAS